MTDIQKCSRCKCKKLLELFKVRKNTGAILKTCIQCCERFKCDIENCDYTCSINSNLQKHIKQVHNKIKDVECEFCNFTCSTNSNLQKHIKEVHNKIRDFECEFCNFTCSQNSNLQQHIKSVHYKIKDFECEFCDYTCSQNSDLQKHIKSVHNKIKDFECEFCNFTCSKNSNLQQHIKSVHNKIKDFECEFCNFTCSTNSNLQQHILTCKGKDNSNMSGLELRTKEALEQLGFFQDKDYIFNSSYSKLTDFCGRPIRPDFRFFDYKIIIEADGIQHYKPQSFGGYKEEAEDNFKSTQESDEIKNNFCEKFGYKMIRIKYTEIKNVLSILHSELDDIIEY
jgi:gas vesicle protein